MSKPKKPSRQELVDDAVRLLRVYLQDHRTDHLKQLAQIVVELRADSRLEDGRSDWSGRSPAYRATMSDIYGRAQVDPAHLDTVQAAIRYHVGNLLRERATTEELEAVGLNPIAPRARIASERAAVIAQRELSAPRQDIARLSAYAQALIDYIDESAIPGLPGERAVAARLALEAIQSRAAQLLVRLADAKARPGAVAAVRAEVTPIRPA